MRELLAARAARDDGEGLAVRESEVDNRFRGAVAMEAHEQVRPYERRARRRRSRRRGSMRSGGYSQPLTQGAGFMRGAHGGFSQQSADHLSVGGGGMSLSQESGVYSEHGGAGFAFHHHLSQPPH